MAKQFYISPDNPIPFTKIVDIDPRFNSVRPSVARTAKTINGCYLQKWQLNDATKIQFLSDYEVTIKVFKNTGIQVATIVPLEVITSLVGYTFKAYEAEFDFSDYGLGKFYAELQFTDEDLQPVVYQSEIWNTAEKWADTMLWEYKNSFNTRSVIYETGIEFNFRVESQIREYTPDSDGEVYIDQMHNATQLSAIPFKKYRLVTDFLPDWALTILNGLLNLQEKKGDGEYYEKPEGSKLEVTHQDGYEYGAASIEVIPVNNFFLNRLIVGDMASGEYVIYPKRLQWIDNAADRTIVGKFRINTTLRRIDIINKGATQFTLRVGTTPGGNEIGDKLVFASDAWAHLVCLRIFDSDTTIYLSGLTGSTTNLFVIYDQDDEVAVSINPSTGGGMRFPKGFSGYWTSSEDQAVSDVWDLGSGLGKTGTPYENCAICDGRNGTTNKLKAYTVGIDSLDNVGDQLNQTVGANTKLITLANLPKHKFTVPMQLSPYSTRSGGSDAERAFIRNFGNPGTNTNEIGNDEVFDVRPLSFKELPFKAITD